MSANARPKLIRGTQSATIEDGDSGTFLVPYTGKTAIGTVKWILRSVGNGSIKCGTTTFTIPQDGTNVQSNSSQVDNSNWSDNSFSSMVNPADGVAFYLSVEPNNGEDTLVVIQYEVLTFPELSE